MRGSCRYAPVCHSSYLSSVYRDLLASALYFNFSLLNMIVIEDTEDFLKKKFSCSVIADSAYSYMAEQVSLSY